MTRAQIEKHYGVKIVDDSFYSSLSGQNVKAYKIIAADGQTWENGLLTIKAVEDECREWEDGLLTIKEKARAAAEAAQKEEKVVATKEQELKALDKIVKIIEDLGEDSYLKTSFEGFEDIARENIQNDMACTWPDRLNSAYDKLDSAVAFREEEAKKSEILEKTAERLKSELDRAIEAQRKAEDAALDARKEVHIRTKDGACDTLPFARVCFHRNEGSFPFINVVEKNGWVTSYKIEDLLELVIS